MQATVVQEGSRGSVDAYFRLHGPHMQDSYRRSSEG